MAIRNLFLCALRMICSKKCLQNVGASLYLSQQYFIILTTRMCQKK